jgi:3-phosphoshikimate 1-carboxyvinyltransferase
VNVLHLEEKNAELVGAVQISAPAEGLGSTAISGTLAAQLIDELPVLAAIAPYTSGGIRIRDAKELRVKESDRIALVAKNLRAMGAEVEEFEPRPRRRLERSEMAPMMVGEKVSPKA